MIVYELSHLFFIHDGEVIHSPKRLGIFSSLKEARAAICYYSELPGFKENTNAFSIREHNVHCAIAGEVIYEPLVYLHSEDYEVEIQVELGLCNSEEIAKGRLHKYCDENSKLCSNSSLYVEVIINKWHLNEKDWREGFSIN